MTLLSPEDLITRMWQIYRVHWGSLLRYVGLMFVLVFLFIILFVIGIAVTIGTSLLSNPEGVNEFLSAATSGGLVAVIILLGILAIILNIWLQIATLRTTSRAVLDQEKISIGTELKHSRPLIWRFLGVSLLMMLILALPLLIALGGWFLLKSNEYFGASAAITNTLNFLFILIGVYSIFHMIYFSISLCFAQIGVSVNGWGIKESLQKSAEWVRGKWWAVLGRLFCAGLILAVPYYVFSGLGYFDNFIGVFFNLVTILYYIAILLPMSLIPSMILYHNFKGDLPTHAPQQK